MMVLVSLFVLNAQAQYVDVQGAIYQITNNEIGGMMGATEPLLVTAEGYEIELVNVSSKIVCPMGSYTIEIVEDSHSKFYGNDKVFANLIEINSCQLNDNNASGWLESEDFASL